MRSADADVLIAGGGLAAQRCCEGLRRYGFDGRIVMLCQETEPPYDRPPLSKTVLTGKQPGALCYRPAGWYAEQDIHLLLGTGASELQPDTHTVLLGAGRRPAAGRLRYRKLVVATGSLPRRLPGLSPGGIVHELRTHADALSFRAALTSGAERLAIIGAGLIGMEVASSARALGLQVTLIEAGPTPLDRVLPSALGRWMADIHRRHRVDVRLATTVKHLARRGAEARLLLSDTTTVAADMLLVAAGTAAATAWLARSGLAAGPIPTSIAGRTQLADVYAAGDAACYPDRYAARRVSTPHWEAAARQGVAVARAIVGMPPQSPPPSMFWSDQHGHRIQLIGHVPGDCRIEFDGDPADGGPFVAWLTSHGRPAAALLFDRPKLVPAARKWIATAHASNQQRRVA